VSELVGLLTASLHGCLLIGGAVASVVGVGLHIAESR